MNISKFILLGLVYLTSACVTAQADQNDPDVVSQVDLVRYVGTWKEIAHSPNFFQGSCVHSTAEYAILNSSSISVHNICYKKDGSTSDINGVATIPNPAIPAKLKVKFNFFARGDYWITALDTQYQWALVSSPGKKSNFILARNAPMDPELLKRILADMKAEGFNTENLIFDKY